MTMTRAILRSDSFHIQVHWQFCKWGLFLRVSLQSLGKMLVSTDRFLMFANSLDITVHAHFRIRTGNEYSP